MNEKLICPLFGQHLFINNHGFANPCCQTRKQYQAHGENEQVWERNVSVVGVEKALQSRTFSDAKSLLDAGKWPSICEKCESDEKIGLHSPRLRSVNRTHIYDQESLKIKSLDLRLGNFCNLECRMCSPFSSSRMVEEWNQGSEQQKFDVQVVRRFERENLNWSEKKEVWEQIFSLSKNVVHINLAGGEPFLNKAHVDFLYRLIESGQSKNIAIEYATNLSFVPSWLENVVREFQSVKLKISVDGFAEMNEFIRFPSKWKRLVDNLEVLDSLSGRYQSLNVIFITTVQIYNILYLKELILFFKNRSWSYLPKNLHSNFVSHPVHFSAKFASQKMKKEAIKRIETFDDQFTRDTIRYLSKNMDHEDMNLFLQENQRIDSYRNQNFFKLAPDFMDFV